MRTCAGKLFSTQVKEPPELVVIIKYIIFTSSSASGNAQSLPECLHAAATHSSPCLAHCSHQGEVRRSYQGGRSCQVEPGCWQWGDSGCPARFALSGQGHLRECCSPGRTGNEEPGVGFSASPSHARLQDAGGSPDVMLRKSPIETPQHLQVYCSHLCMERPHQPSAKGSAMASNCGNKHPGCSGHQPLSRATESVMEKEIQKQQMKACLSNSCMPAGARRGPDMLETWCRAVLVSL